MILCLRDPRRHSWRWGPILEKWGHLRVFINPLHLYSTTFLVHQGEPISSVFFVSLPLDDKGHVAYYAITTLHSVRDTEVFIRFNLKGGGIHHELIDPNDWEPSLTTDVAALPIHFSLDPYDIWFVEQSRFAQHKYALRTLELSETQRELIDPYHTGDEVFTVGLFEGHAGEHFAQPAARFGHIALQPKPGEKINALVDPKQQKYKAIDAFLVELSTWEGQSGSPVFLRAYVDESSRSIVRDSTETAYLIGMIQGFYPAREEYQFVDGGTLKVPVNTGIGIVIPTEQIVELLMTENLMKDRERQLKEKSKPKIRPSAATISAKKEEETEFTGGQFDQALRLASRKTSQPETKRRKKSR
jgi:hypothetical protein